MILKTKETYNNQVFLTTKVFSKLLYKTNFCNKKGNQILLGIDILKDASATAIYGSRGANGVVLITTKKGLGSTDKFEYSSSLSISEVANTYDLMGRDEFVDAVVKFGGKADVVDFGGSTDWQDEIFRVSLSQNHNLTYSNSYEGGSYRASLSLDDQQGIVRNSSFRSSDIRINLNQNINRNLKFEARLSAFFSDSDFAEGGDLIGSSNQSFVRNAIAFRPVITADVDDIEQDLETSNPYAWINDFKDISDEEIRHEAYYILDQWEKDIKR